MTGVEGDGEEGKELGCASSGHRAQVRRLGMSSHYPEGAGLRVWFAQDSTTSSGAPDRGHGAHHTGEGARVQGCQLGLLQGTG